MVVVVAAAHMVVVVAAYCMSDMHDDDFLDSSHVCLTWCMFDSSHVWHVCGNAGPVGGL